MIEIWTDGSCNFKNRVGGWGVVIVINSVEVELSGSAINTTNNAMELTAVLKGLSAIPIPAEVEIYTDSEYVKNGIENNGWVHRGSDIPNYKLWCHMNRLVNHHESVTPIWVRGHSGVYHNERADILAGIDRKKRLRRCEKL